MDVPASPVALKLEVSTPFRSFGSPAYFSDSAFGAGDDAAIAEPCAARN